MKKYKFIDYLENANEQNLIPINYYFLEGRNSFEKEKSNNFIKLVECNKYRSQGYASFKFFKKISKY